MLPLDLACSFLWACAATVLMGMALMLVGTFFGEFEEHLAATYLDASGFNGRRQNNFFCLEAEQNVVANPICFIVLIPCTR